MDDKKVAVCGAFHTSPLKPGERRQLEEQVFAAARGALADAEMAIEDIDAIVISSDDQMHGRIIESMVMAGAVGAVSRDLTTLASAGEHAFIYAYLRLRAGMGKRILVVSWGHPSEAVDVRHVELVAAEPFVMRPHGVTKTVAAGLQAMAYEHRYGSNPALQRSVQTARSAAASRTYGFVNSDAGEDVVAWPLRAIDLPRHTDMAAAVVLVSEDAVSSQGQIAWVNGVGWATDHYELASRDLSRFRALELAADRAFGRSELRPTVDVAEVQELSTIAAFIAIESLGFADRGHGGSKVLEGQPVINPSGGNLPFDPANAAGFLRLLFAAEQIRGKAGAGQLWPTPVRSLGAALHGLAGQGASVVVFGAEREDYSCAM